MFKKILTGVLALGMLASIGILGASATGVEVEITGGTQEGSDGEFYYYYDDENKSGRCAMMTTADNTRYGFARTELYNINNSLIKSSQTDGIYFIPDDYKGTDTISSSNAKRVAYTGKLYGTSSMSSYTLMDYFAATHFFN
jgi:hypothetical protein